jgi:glycerophosphoryl diester phosphodiesterase
LRAFEAAIAAGADAVELDARRTADGVIVVHHSPVRRGTPVSRLTLAELRRRCRVEPPTLEDVIATCAGRVALDIEIKEPGFEARVLDIALARLDRRRVLITSFHPEVVRTVGSLRTGVACGLLVGRHRFGRGREAQDLAPLVAARRCGADFLAPHQLWLALRPHSRRRPLAGSALLAAATDEAMPVVVWTVNGTARLQQYLADPRIEGIITDLPGLAAQLRRTRPEPANASPESAVPKPVTASARPPFPGRVRPNSGR